MHKKDVVDLLWMKLNNAELAMFVASIKVDYRRNCQKYTDILQEIATQIPTGKTPPFTTDGILELNMGGNNNRSTSACPTDGTHLTGDTLYTVSYAQMHLVSSAVTPQHDEIRASREEGRGEQKSNYYKKGRQQKREVSELRSQISELDSTKQRLIYKLPTKIDNVKPTGGGN